MQTIVFKDRRDAGQKLSGKLIAYKGKQLIILALPRGGVVVAYEVSKILNIPLDVLVVRKIGSPNNPEFAIGAIAEGGIRILDEDSVRLTGASLKEIQNIIDEEKKELKRRVKLYRQGKSPVSLEGKTVILIDDGLATGMTAKAAIESVRKLKPEKIIFAVPVCAYETGEEIRGLVDDFICISNPVDMGAIGAYYQDFKQVADEEVINILNH